MTSLERDVAWALRTLGDEAEAPVIQARILTTRGVEPSLGAVHSICTRFVRQGYATMRDGPTRPGRAGAPVRYYRITDRGKDGHREALCAHLDRLFAADDWAGSMRVASRAGAVISSELC